MKRIRDNYYVSEERLAMVAKNHYGSDKNVFQWLISLFKGKAKETSEPKK